MENSSANDNNNTHTHAEHTAKPDGHESVESVKAVSAIAYIGLLFFVPMLTNPKSEFAMFHANQGLLLLLTSLAVNFVGGAIPVIGWLFIIPIGNIFVIVLMIMGIVNALQMQMKRLPLIGGFDLLKPTK